MTLPEKIATLRLKNLGIDTYNEAVIYMLEDCHVCRAEGFEAQARILVTLGDKSIIATLNMIESNLLSQDEASLSTFAWKVLQAKVGDEIVLTHPKPLASLKYVRAKIYGRSLSEDQFEYIIRDVVKGSYSDIDVTMFLTACAGVGLNSQEIYYLTNSMIRSGQQLQWPSKFAVDKHCVGGLPGNRTTLILVPIIAEFGMTIPKTSSRAITSPAGTADTMEVFSPVNLTLEKMRKVVEQENGCIVWGGSVSLSPADDTLIRIERAMNIDAQGQLVASILSKKIAAGSTHILIDVPIGSSVKIRSLEEAENLKNELQTIGVRLGVELKVLFTDGSQPIGRGIGPALEARDVLAVLSCQKEAPQDLRERSLMLAGAIIEFSPSVAPGQGQKIATEILESGRAFKKFQAICKAQGGMAEPPIAHYHHVVKAKSSGIITNINNRLLAQLAKLAGAPRAKAAGISLATALNSPVVKGEPLFTIFAESRGELNYALSYLEHEKHILTIEADK
ncbi:MAG: thymidine phosphorylase family protein [Candidatus Berkiellales bacterium]